MEKGTKDFGCYYYGAMEIQKQNPDLYKPIIYKRTDFGYPPLTAMLFIPFLIFSLSAAMKIWNILNIILLIFNIILWYKIFKIVHIKIDFILIAILMLFFNPIMETIAWGQSNLLIFTLLSIFIYLYINSKLISAGIILGLASAIKLLPGIFILYFLIKKKIKLFIISSLTVLVLFSVSILYVNNGLSLYKIYVTQKVPELNRTAWFGNPYNNSFKSLFHRMFDPDSLFPKAVIYNSPESGRILTGIVTFSILFISLFTVFKIKNKSNVIFLLEFFLLQSTAHLFNNLTWEHHFIFLIPGYIILLYYNYIHKNFKIFILTIISYLILALKFGYDYPGIANSIFSPLSSIKLFAVLLFYILTIITLNFKKNEE